MVNGGTIRLFQEVEASQRADADAWRRFMAAADELVYKEMMRDIEWIS